MWNFWKDLMQKKHNFTWMGVKLMAIQLKQVSFLPKEKVLQDLHLEGDSLRAEVATEDVDPFADLLGVVEDSIIVVLQERTDEDLIQGLLRDLPLHQESALHQGQDQGAQTTRVQRGEDRPQDPGQEVLIVLEEDQTRVGVVQDPDHKLDFRK